jgi:hypothetical protein
MFESRSGDHPLTSTGSNRDTKSCFLRAESNFRSSSRIDDHISRAGRWVQPSSCWGLTLEKFSEPLLPETVSREIKAGSPLCMGSISANISAASQKGTKNLIRKPPGFAAHNPNNCRRLVDSPARMYVSPSLLFSAAKAMPSAKAGSTCEKDFHRYGLCNTLNRADTSSRP